MKQTNPLMAKYRDALTDLFFDKSFDSETRTLIRKHLIQASSKCPVILDQCELGD